MKELMKRGLRVAVVTTLAIAVVAAWGSEQTATASEDVTDVEIQDDEIASLEEGPIVRRQLLHRASRLELEPKATFTLNDTYVRNGIVGLSGTYFLNNAFGFGASVGMGVLSRDTSLRRNLEGQMTGGDQDEISYSEVGFMADASLVWVPAFGKLSVMSSMFSHYDFHILGGMGFVQQSAETASGSGSADPELEGVQAAPMVGAGLRFFTSDRMSLNFQLRNYLNFNHAEISRGNADPRLGLMTMFSVGLGFYLPGDVHISR